jgi:hypothetical protein
MKSSDLPTPYGNLPFAFVGLLQGKFQVVQLQGRVATFQKPLGHSFDTKSSSRDCITLPKPVLHKRPSSDLKHLEAGKGCSSTLALRHAGNGNNLLIRHHAYFRLDSPDCHRRELQQVTILTLDRVRGLEPATPLQTSEAATHKDTDNFLVTMANP